MWKQVNNLLGQLSPYRSHSHKRNGSEGADHAGVELSVRQATPAATELRPVTGKKASQAAAVAQPSSAGGSAGSQYNYHPLESAGKHEAAQAAVEAPAAVDLAKAHGTIRTSHDHTAAKQISPEYSSDCAKSLLARLTSQHWVDEFAAAPSSARLVLSMVWQLAADSSLQQQQQLLLVKLRQIVSATTWQEACGLCKDTLLLRALVQHVCQDSSASLVDGSWAQLHQQTVPQGSLAAQFVSTAAALAEAWARDSKDSSSAAKDARLDMQQLESCILLGSAVQLQQQLQDDWGLLNQLAAKSAQQAGAHQAQQQLQQQEGQHKELCVELQQAVAASWPLLQAWITTTLGAASLQQPQAHHGQEDQQQPAQWDHLLAVLKHLQQQVQGAVPAAVQPNPLQQDLQAVSADPGTSSGSSTADSSSSPIPSRQSSAEHSECLQERYQVLLELCSSVPPMLQPRDLAGSLEAAAGAPDSLVLVVLMRLAAATHHLWHPLLAAASRTTDLPAATAAAADTGLPLQHSGAPAASRPKLQLEPVLATADGTQLTAEVWQRPEVQQIAAGLADAPASASIGAGNASVLRSPRSSWPDELLSTTQLWPGEVDNEADAAAITREERTLRCWINSVLHRNANSAAAPQGLLAQTFSVDSGVRAAQGTHPSAAPFRTLSLGGGSMQGSPLPVGPVAVPHRRSSASGDNSSSDGGSVFRTSSAGTAARAVQPSSDAGGSETAHSRSISADAEGPSVVPSLEGLCSEPAAPSTPTSAAATGTGLGPTAYTGSSRVGGSAVLVPSITSVSSLFGAELRSGVLLLEILELLQPGCVDWRLANRPPFVSRTAQIKALENCQLALKIAKEELGLPLVSMSPRDIVLGRRKIILSLVYQLMRYNTMQLLESISAVHQEQRSSSRRGSTTGGSEPSTPVAVGPHAADEDSRLPGAEQQLPPSGMFGARQSWAPVNIRSSSRKQQRQVAISEQDILDWANGKLQLVQPLAGSDFTTTTPVIRSFKDPVLSSGVVLLQLLHVLAPDLVDRAFVTPGHTAEQRQSNARYALSLADKMGCSLFLVWEDLVDRPQPRMVLVLLASLMYQDLQRQQANQVHT